MKSSTLEVIEGAMTPGDWWISDEDGEICAGPPGPESRDVGPADFNGQNLYGVIVLRNHAKALIALVKAVERRKATLCYSVSPHEPMRARECQCGARYAPECPIRAADRAVYEAHAAIESLEWPGGSGGGAQ